MWLENELLKEIADANTEDRRERARKHLQAREQANVVRAFSLATRTAREVADGNYPYGLFARQAENILAPYQLRFHPVTWVNDAGELLVAFPVEGFERLLQRKFIDPERKRYEQDVPALAERFTDFFNAGNNFFGKGELGFRRDRKDAMIVFRAEDLRPLLGKIASGAITIALYEGYPDPEDLLSGKLPTELEIWDYRYMHANAAGVAVKDERFHPGQQHGSTHRMHYPVDGRTLVEWFHDPKTEDYAPPKEWIGPDGKATHAFGRFASRVYGRMTWGRLFLPQFVGQSRFVFLDGEPKPMKEMSFVRAMKENIHFPTLAHVILARARDIETGAHGFASEEHIGFVGIAYGHALYARCIDGVIELEHVSFDEPRPVVRRQYWVTEPMPDYDHMDIGRDHVLHEHPYHSC